MTNSDFTALLRAAGLCVALSLVPAVHLLAQTVEVRAGNIFHVDGHGVARQLTTGGMDSDPSLSFDGRTVIFVRRTSTPAGFEEPTDLHPTRNQIHVAGVANATESKAVFDDLVVVGNARYATFSEPHLAPDNRHAYFPIHRAVVEIRAG